MKHWENKKYQKEAIVINQGPSDEALNFEGGQEKRHQILRKTLCQDNTVTNCEGQVRMGNKSYLCDPGQAIDLARPPFLLIHLWNFWSFYQLSHSMTFWHKVFEPKRWLSRHKWGCLDAWRPLRKGPVFAKREVGQVWLDNFSLFLCQYFPTKYLPGSILMGSQLPKLPDLLWGDLLFHSHTPYPQIFSYQLATAV